MNPIFLLLLAGGAFALLSGNKDSPPKPSPVPVPPRPSKPERSENPSDTSTDLGKSPREPASEADAYGGRAFVTDKESGREGKEGRSLSQGKKGKTDRDEGYAAGTMDARRSLDLILDTFLGTKYLHVVHPRWIEDASEEWHLAYREGFDSELKSRGYATDEDGFLEPIED